MTQNGQIAALLAERAGYIRRNLPLRVKAVDASLHALGYETATAEPVAERAMKEQHQRRKAK